MLLHFCFRLRAHFAQIGTSILDIIIGGTHSWIEGRAYILICGRARFHITNVPTKRWIAFLLSLYTIVIRKEVFKIKRATNLQLQVQLVSE